MQRLNELLNRYAPEQVDSGAQGRAASARDHSRCLCEISISPAADCCAVTAGERPFATNNHLIQTLLLFHAQHGWKHNSIKIQQLLPCYCFFLVSFFFFLHRCRFQGETVAPRGKQSFASAKAGKQQRAGKVGPDHASATPVGVEVICRGAEGFLRRLLLLLQASGCRPHLCGWALNNEFAMRAKLWPFLARLMWPRGAEQRARRVTQPIRLNVAPAWGD